MSRILSIIPKERIRRVNLETVHLSSVFRYGSVNILPKLLLVIFKFLNNLIGMKFSAPNIEALPEVLGIQGEGLFSFRDLRRRVIYFQGFGEKT